MEGACFRLIGMQFQTSKSKLKCGNLKVGLRKLQSESSVWESNP